MVHAHSLGSADTHWRGNGGRRLRDGHEVDLCLAQWLVLAHQAREQAVQVAVALVVESHRHLQHAAHGDGEGLDVRARPGRAVVDHQVGGHHLGGVGSGGPEVLVASLPEEVLDYEAVGDDAQDVEGIGLGVVLNTSDEGQVGHGISWGVKGSLKGIHQLERSG